MCVGIQEMCKIRCDLLTVELSDICVSCERSSNKKQKKPTTPTMEGVKQITDNK